MAIKYDVHEYQEACDLVRNARDRIKELPKNLQEEVKGILKTAVKETYLTFKEIYEPTNDFQELSENQQTGINEIVKMAVKGTYLACKAIYEPTTEPGKVKRAGSDTDFETDKKGLSELENLFD